MSTQTEDIKCQIETLLTFYNKYSALTTCHTVDYFTKNLFKTCLSEDLQKELRYLNHKNIVSNILENNLDSTAPVLETFIKYAKENSLYNSKVCFSHKNFQSKLISLNNDDNFKKSLKLKVFVTEKKSHEIEVMSVYIAALKNIGNTSHIVDLGDGKGYLSSILALNYNIKVLGIDCSSNNTQGAVKRLRKLGKVWNSLENKDVDSNNCADIYKQSTEYVTVDTDISKLVTELFLEESTGLSLTGLHTCGNLGSTSIRMYIQNESIRTICNVSCCYNLMNEMFEEPLNNNIGFPLSDFLQKRKIILGREGRMLAAQTIDRMFYNKTIDTKIIFYRAVLQVLLNEHFNQDVQSRHVGRLKKTCNTFAEYCAFACKKLNIDLNKTVEELNDFYSKYSTKYYEYKLFYLIRMMLAPTIEAIILLDRLLYLHENKLTNSYLVQIFDPVISPRCYALVSYK